VRTVALLVAMSAFAALAWMREEAGGGRRAASAPSRESCAECHARRQPGLMAQWNESAHARHEVSCEECHGDDHDAIFNAKGRVPVSTCGRCHPRAAREFLGSAHDRASSDARKNARLLAQIPAMQRRGCMSCHDIGTGADGRCNACHGAHRFSAADARRPESCGQCHMGPDHPQLEAFESSRHGVVYRATGDERQAPTCSTCHMPDGTHDVSGGVTIGRAGSGAVLEGETPPIPMKTITPEEFEKRRAAMLLVCTNCHSPRFARTALEDADAIKRDADRIVREAARIVQGLYDDGLLDPMPEERPAHPTAGHALVLGGPALYEGHSEPERIFFDIAKFAHAITYKGAYHQSPDYTHWLGNARLKEGLEALRAEERRLRK
jgi:hydroxylamine dehydrogenase